jgi:ATP-binding cassette subfamily C protein
MRLLLTLIQAYPWRTGFAFLAVLFAGIADGASVSAMLPLLKLATAPHGANAVLLPGSDVDGGEKISHLEKLVVGALANVGLEATIGVLLIVVVTGVIARSLLMLVANRHVGYSAAHISTELRLSLLRAVLSTRWDYFLHQPIGRLANSMATEANRTSRSYIVGITMLAMLLQSLVYAGLAIAVSWKATLAVIVVAMVILALSHILVKMARRAGKRQTELFKSLLARLTDTLQSVKSLKAMAREELAGAVLSAETSRLNRALQLEVLSDAVLDAVQAPMFAIVVAIGIYVAIEKMGMPFSSVMVLVILLGRVLNQLQKTQKMYQKLGTTQSAFWSLRREIKQAEKAREITTGTLEPDPVTPIRFENVSFAYGDKRVLKDVSLTIKPRALTTIIGPSGAGKTTMIDLVIGLYHPVSGTVYLGDIPLTEVDMKKWREKIGYVPQEQVLLHDTIMTNITFGDPRLTEADAENALRAANAWEFVKELPDGLYSNVGERGTKLSGGQRQRIMIARALAHRPAVLILDEPTSALDPDSAAVVTATLQRLSKDYTVIAISHQHALAESADVTYRFQQGLLIQAG